MKKRDEGGKIRVDFPSLCFFPLQNIKQFDQNILLLIRSIFFFFIIIDLTRCVVVLLFVFTYISLHRSPPKFRWSLFKSRVVTCEWTNLSQSWETVAERRDRSLRTTTATNQRKERRSKTLSRSTTVSTTTEEEEEVSNSPSYPIQQVERSSRSTR